MTRPAVLITGAARRVGAALALYFSRKGYDIALHYHESETEARALQKEIEGQGVACALYSHDLRDIAGIPALMGRVKAHMPDCAALINNASVFERAGFLETDEALFDRQMTVNFKAPFFLTQEFARHFGQGAVVNILDASMGNTQGSHFAYLLSKKALADFTLMAARALGPNLRVNGVCPGCMLPSSQNDETYERKMEAVIPLKRHPSLDDLSEAVGFLIERPYLTGQLLYVDGGMHVL